MSILPGKSVALMQPYLFPYLGYYQLINCVDEFILYDNVQYMKGGWINRNRILENGKPVFITVPVRKGNLSDLICEKSVLIPNRDRATRKLLKRIESCYRSAPFFDNVFNMLREILQYDTSSLSELLEFSIRSVTSFLNIETRISLSSSLQVQNGNLHGQDRVLSILQEKKATDYINAIGGLHLYDRETFRQNGIQLQFIKPVITPYQQSTPNFIPDLSIIDVMMFNSVNTIQNKLNEYELA